MKADTIDGAAATSDAVVDVVITVADSTDGSACVAISFVDDNGGVIDDDDATVVGGDRNNSFVVNGSESLLEMCILDSDNVAPVPGYVAGLGGLHRSWGLVETTDDFETSDCKQL